MNKKVKTLSVRITSEQFNTLCENLILKHKSKSAYLREIIDQTCRTGENHKQSTTLQENRDNRYPTHNKLKNNNIC